MLSSTVVPRLELDAHIDLRLVWPLQQLHRWCRQRNPNKGDEYGELSRQDRELTMNSLRTIW